jgi:hypothetical protein
LALCTDGSGPRSLVYAIGAPAEALYSPQHAMFQQVMAYHAVIDGRPDGVASNSDLCHGGPACRGL